MWRNEYDIMLTMTLECTKSKCNVKRIDTSSSQSSYDVGKTKTNFSSQWNGVLQSKLNDLKRNNIFLCWFSISCLLVDILYDYVWFSSKLDTRHCWNDDCSYLAGFCHHHCHHSHKEEGNGVCVLKNCHLLCFKIKLTFHFSFLYVNKCNIL